MHFGVQETDGIGSGYKIILLDSSGKTAFADNFESGTFSGFFCAQDMAEVAVFCNPVRKITANTVTDLICSNDDTPPMGKRMPIGFLGYQSNE